jgi:hypothetical protein
MQNPMRVLTGVEGNITPDIFHNLTQGKISDERLTELIRNEAIRAYEMNGSVIIDIGSVRRWLGTVNPVTLKPINRDLF